MVRRTETYYRHNKPVREHAYYSLLNLDLCECGPHSQRNDAARCLGARVRTYHQGELAKLPKRRRFAGTIEMGGAK